MIRLHVKTRQPDPPLVERQGNNRQPCTVGTDVFIIYKEPYFSISTPRVLLEIPEDGDGGGVLYTQFTLPKLDFHASFS